MYVRAKQSLLTWLRAVDARMWVDDREHFDHIQAAMEASNVAFVEAHGVLSLNRLMRVAYDEHVGRCV